MTQVSLNPKLIDSLIDSAVKSPHNQRHAAGLLDRRSRAPVTIAHNEPRNCYDGVIRRCCGHAEFLACWQGRKLSKGAPISGAPWLQGA